MFPSETMVKLSDTNIKFTANIKSTILVATFKDCTERTVVDSSVGRSLSISHKGPQFKSWHRHLFVLLLICDLIDCWLMLEPIGWMTVLSLRRESIKNFYNMYCICNPTCVYCLFKKGQTPVKSNSKEVKLLWKLKKFWQEVLYQVCAPKKILIWNMKS
jgi:hypothetical protein